MYQRMLFTRIYDEDLAQASYFIGCQATGEAAVVDPRRDVRVYLDEAENNGMGIVAVTETHIHADYLSGSRELAAATGAALYLSGEGPAEWQYGFEGEKLHDGDEIRVGNVTLRAIHTPGHTPEHLSFLVTDKVTTNEPGFVLTATSCSWGSGKTRPARRGRRQERHALRRSQADVREPVREVPCLARLHSGLARARRGERLRQGTGRGPQLDGRLRTALLLVGPLRRKERRGRVRRSAARGAAGRPRLLRPHEAAEQDWSRAAGDEITATTLRCGVARNVLARGEVILVDTRPSEDFVMGAVPGSLNVPAAGSFAARASWVIDPERVGKPIVLLTVNEAGASRLRNELSYVGVDNVVGYVTSLRNLQMERAAFVSPQDLEKLGNAFVLDVRAKSEYEAGHIPGAIQLHGGRVMWHLGELPRDRPIVVYCQTGSRSAVVASALRAAGFEDVVELEGSYEGYQKAKEQIVGA